MKVWNWFKNIFSSLKKESTVLAVEMNEEVIEFFAEISQHLQEEKKYFLVEADVPTTTKLRELKITMEATLVEKLAKTNPDISNIVVKSFYNRK